MLRDCDCHGWQIGADQLRAQGIFCHIQTAGPEYTGPEFDYCPWCGKLLEDRELLARLEGAED